LTKRLRSTTIQDQVFSRKFFRDFSLAEGLIARNSIDEKRVGSWIGVDVFGHCSNHGYVRPLVKGELEEFYGMEEDPEELTNLVKDPAHAKQVDEYRAAAIAELRRTGAGFVDGMPQPGQR